MMKLNCMLCMVGEQRLDILELKKFAELYGKDSPCRGNNKIS